MSTMKAITVLGQNNIVMRDTPIRELDPDECLCRVVYTGASYADDANTLKVPGWTRFDAGLRYMMDVDGHVVTLRARVENIANRNYWSSVGGYPGNGYLVLGGPRTFSLSASMDF